jgi:hypothetical protein
MAYRVTSIYGKLVNLYPEEVQKHITRENTRTGDKLVSFSLTSNSGGYAVSAMFVWEIVK